MEKEETPREGCSCRVRWGGAFWAKGRSRLGNLKWSGVSRACSGRKAGAVRKWEVLPAWRRRVDLTLKALGMQGCEAGGGMGSGVNRFSAELSGDCEAKLRETGVQRAAGQEEQRFRKEVSSQGRRGCHMAQRGCSLEQLQGSCPREPQGPGSGGGPFEVPRGSLAMKRRWERKGWGEHELLRIQREGRQ